MNLYKNIPILKDFPNNVYIVVEMTNYNSFVKYEINDYGILEVDRFMDVPMFYPYNYGFIINTLYKDNDCIDSLVITNRKIVVGSIIKCKPIGMLNMIDESGIDNKILSVPSDDISYKYGFINDICDLSKNSLSKISYFFKHYKDFDKNRWVNIGNYFNNKIAKYEIINSYNRFLNFNK